MCAWEHALLHYSQLQLLVPEDAAQEDMVPSAAQGTTPGMPAPPIPLRKGSAGLPAHPIPRRERVANHPTLSIADQAGYPQKLLGRPERDQPAGRPESQHWLVPHRAWGGGGGYPVLAAPQWGTTSHEDTSPLDGHRALPPIYLCWGSELGMPLDVHSIGA